MIAVWERNSIKVATEKLILDGISCWLGNKLKEIQQGGTFSAHQRAQMIQYLRSGGIGERQARAVFRKERPHPE